MVGVVRLTAAAAAMTMLMMALVGTTQYYGINSCSSSSRSCRFRWGHAPLVVTAAQ
jgi:hypothetical protein